MNHDCKDVEAPQNNRLAELIAARETLIEQRHTASSRRLLIDVVIVVAVAGVLLYWLLIG